MPGPFLSRRELTGLTGKTLRRSQMKWLTEHGFEFEIHEPTKHPLIKRADVLYRDRLTSPQLVEPVYPPEPQEAEVHVRRVFIREPWRKYAERWIPLTYSSTKKNAAKRHITFELSMAEYLALIERANGRCMLSGIPFDTRHVGKGKRRPWAPSLDRIDSCKGYSAQNCRLVCVAANLAMNEWGEGVLRTLAKALTNRRAKKQPIESETAWPS